MSTELILEDLNRTREHILNTKKIFPYPFINEKLEKARNLYLKWLGMYIDECERLQSIHLKISESENHIRFLSHRNQLIRNYFNEVFAGNIPDEAYILVDFFYKLTGHQDISYALTKRLGFSQSSIYEEALIAEEGVKHISPERVDAELRIIQNNDCIKLCYSQYEIEDPLSWLLLFHECLHSIYSEEKFSILFENELPLKKPWVKEAIIDYLSMKMLGPSYVVALADHLAKFPHIVKIEEASHPDPAARLYEGILYLKDLPEKTSQFPKEISNGLQSIYGNIEKMWAVIKHRAIGMQDEVELIFKHAEMLFNKYDKEWKKDKKFEKFEDFFLHFENNQKENMSLSLDEIFEYYKIGIPVGVDPRIMFTLLAISKEMPQEKRLLFARESLKKFYITSVWTGLRKS